MKYLIVAAIVFSVFQVKSCPACNIHNYLDGSIQASKNIYKGRVKEEKKEGVFSIEVIEILRMDEKKPFSVGDVKSEYLYPSIRQLGSEFIFCDPYTSGVSFEILDARLEYEVKYLMDSARTITSVSQAVTLLEGISRSSYREAKEYVKNHYAECYDRLASRVVEFRKTCQAKEESFFNDHRLTNLLSGLLIDLDERSKRFVLSEVDAIAKGTHDPVTLDSLGYSGTSVMGEYLREILRLTEKIDFGDTLKRKYIDYINSDSTITVMYFTYALALTHVDVLNGINVSEANKDYVVLGVVAAALWNKYYWQRAKIPPLLSKIEELSPNDEVKNFVEKRFEDYLKVEANNEEPPKKDSFRERRRNRKSIKQR